MSSPFQQKFKGKSPLNQGAYESAADKPVVISNQPAINAMFNTIAEVGAAAVKSAYSPENKAKRQDKRIKKRDDRAIKRKARGEKNEDGWSEKRKARFDKRTERFEKRTEGVETKSEANKEQAKLNAQRKNRPTYDADGNKIKYASTKSEGKDKSGGDAGFEDKVENSVDVFDAEAYKKEMNDKAFPAVPGNKKPQQDESFGGHMGFRI